MKNAKRIVGYSNGKFIIDTGDGGWEEIDDNGFTPAAAIGITEPAQGRVGEVSDWYDYMCGFCDGVKLVLDYSKRG